MSEFFKSDDICTIIKLMKHSKYAVVVTLNYLTKNQTLNSIWYNLCYKGATPRLYENLKRDIANEYLPVLSTLKYISTAVQ